MRVRIRMMTSSDHEDTVRLSAVIWPILANLLRNPSVRRRCGFLKLFLVAAVPLGLIPMTLGMWNQLKCWFWWFVIVFITWIGGSAGAFYYIALIVSAFKWARTDDFRQLTAPLRRRRCGRLLLYACKEYLFEWIVRIIALVTQLGDIYEFHSLGCAMAITLQSIVCLCCQHDDTILSSTMLSTFVEMLFWQVVIDIWNGAFRMMQFLTTGVVVFVCLVARVTDSGAGPLLPP